VGDSGGLWPGKGTTRSVSGSADWIPKIFIIVVELHMDVE